MDFVMLAKIEFFFSQALINRSGLIQRFSSGAFSDPSSVYSE
jgi:hypothetical protein